MFDLKSAVRNYATDRLFTFTVSQSVDQSDVKGV